MDGYMGVKFETIERAPRLPDFCLGLFSDFEASALRLRKHGMTPKNGGNMSLRLDRGFVITASGCNLGLIDPDEVIFVEGFSLEEKRVVYAGPRKPSSETFLHALIYRHREAARAVVHAHDPATAACPLVDDVEETPWEEPYGTVELARLAIETFRKDKKIIVLRNHGYVSTGDSLTEAVDTIMSIHHRLLGEAKGTAQ